MDIREWSFRQSVAYYHCLEEEYILISEKFTVDEGYRMGKELLKKVPCPPHCALRAIHWQWEYCRH